MIIQQISLYNKIKKYLGFWYKETCLDYFNCDYIDKSQLKKWNIKYTAIKKDVDFKKYVFPYHWDLNFIYKYNKTEYANNTNNNTENIYEYDVKNNTLIYKKESVKGKKIEYYYLYNKNIQHIATFKYIDKVLKKVDVENENDFDLSVKQ